MAKFLKEIQMAGNNITGLPAEPSGNDAAASKAYVDSKAAPVASVNTKTGAVVLTAGDIGATDTNNLTETHTVQGILDALFTYANNGKSTIAGVIGDPATSDNTFAQLAGYITTAKADLDSFIDSAEGTTTGSETLAQLTAKLDQVRVYKSQVRLRQMALSTFPITLKTPIAKEKLVVSLFQRVNDGATTSLVANFNNGKPSDFNTNTNVSYDGGVMQLAVDSQNLTLTEVIGSGFTNGTLYTGEIDMNNTNWSDFKITSINSSTQTISYQRIPTPTVVTASGDIALDNVGDITEIELVKSVTGNGNVRFALSFNQGATYRVWNGSAFVTLDITDLTAFSTNGMTSSSGITVSAFDTERNGSNNLRFAYYLSRPTFSDVALVDEILLNVLAIGSMRPSIETQSTTHPTITYTLNGSNLVTAFTVTFIQEDLYQINYIDTP